MKDVKNRLNNHARMLPRVTYSIHNDMRVHADSPDEVCLPRRW